MEQSNEPNFFFIIFGLFLIIAIVIVMFIYFKQGDRIKEFFNEEEPVVENITIVKEYYDLEIESNAESSINYTLYNKGEIVVEGILNPDIKEQYTLAEINQTYKLTGISNLYYYNEVECLVKGNRNCNLNLKKTANYSLEYINNILYFKNYNNGVMQQPLICVAWTFDLYIVEILDLNKVQIPNRLKTRMDVCYDLKRDISQNLTYDVDVIRVNPKVSNITFMLIDKESNRVGVLTYEQDERKNDVILNVQV